MMLSRIIAAAAAVIVIGLSSGRASAAEGKLMIYPAGGQTEQQLADDRYACHLQAVDRSGFDPSASAPVPSGPISVAVPDNPREGATAKGAIAGAIAGAVLGHGSRSAVGGAIAGAVVGGAVEAQGEAEAHGQAAEEANRLAAARAQAEADFDRRRAEYRQTIRACMEQRGYTVR